MGKDLDHFRIDLNDDLPREKAAEYNEILRQQYGEKPNNIHILFPFDNPDDVWSAWLEAYTAGRMVARADGERFLYKVNTDTNVIEVYDGQPLMEYHDGMPVGSYVSRSTNEKVSVFCKPVGRLQVVIPELSCAAALTLVTCSKHDIMTIDSQLSAYSALTNGRLSSVPFILKKVQRNISTPGEGGKVVRRTKWLVEIEASPEWASRKRFGVGAALPPGNVAEGEFKDLKELPESNDMKKITYQDYWQLVYDTKTPKEQAGDLLSKHGGDFEAAYYELKKMTSS
jgi:hypothetical protein